AQCGATRWRAESKDDILLRFRCSVVDNRNSKGLDYFAISEGQSAAGSSIVSRRGSTAIAGGVVHSHDAGHAARASNHNLSRALGLFNDEEAAGKLEHSRIRPADQGAGREFRRVVVRTSCGRRYVVTRWSDRQ